MVCVAPRSWAHLSTYKAQYWKMITWTLFKFMCALSGFRVLLEEGKATVPCLAERLTTELIWHINVSQWVELQALKMAACPSHFLSHGLTKTLQWTVQTSRQQAHSENQISPGQRLMRETLKWESNNCITLKQRVESVNLGEAKKEGGKL